MQIKLSKKARAIRSKVGIRIGDEVETVNAIWDTGSSRTVVSTKLAQKLSPVEGASAWCVGPTGERIPGEVYSATIILPDDVEVTLDFVMAMSIADVVRYDVIIGLDIILRGDFRIANKGKMCLVKFSMPEACCDERSSSIREQSA